MKRIIEGKRYDTDAPQTTLLGEADGINNGAAESVTDFAFWEAGLYRTAKGAYFLAGRGGPMTRFAKRRGNITEGDEKIIPLSKEEAQEWAERYLSADTVGEYFKIEEA